MNKKALTTYDIADHCQVTPRTVIQWINEGKLKAYRTVGNHSRVLMEEFLAFLKKYNMPLPVEESPSSNKKKILIVDDDKGMVDAIYRILNTEKVYDLEVAYDGFEAGEKFAGFKPELVILDIKMPGLDGYQVCSRIRENQKNKDVRILLVSGIIDEKQINRIKGSGANDYLCKPFSNEELRMKVMGLFGLNRRSSDRAVNQMNLSSSGESV